MVKAAIGVRDSRCADSPESQVASLTGRQLQRLIEALCPAEAGGGPATRPRGADLRANCRSRRQRKGCRRARRQFLPQHSTEPSVLTPQVWKSPALTEAKAP